MINYEKINEKYFIFSDLDIGKYGPFDGIWIKGGVIGKEFSYDFSKLKTWKNVVGIYNDKIYLFEENFSKLNYLT